MSAAKERADFICAVIAGLEDLEAGREFGFDDAAIRLGLDRERYRHERRLAMGVGRRSATEAARLGITSS